MGNDEVLSRGDLVVHPARPEWGPGKIVHVDRGMLFVFFRDVGERKAMKFKPGTLLRAAVQSDPVLDNLPPVTMEGGTPMLPQDRWSVDNAVKRFLEHYPAGFSDPAYLGDRASGERTYKWEAHGRLSEFLAAKRREISSGRSISADFPRELQRALGPASNLPATNELIAFREGLNDVSASECYLHSLLDLLDRGPEEDAFTAHADAVADLPVTGLTDTNKWTLVTLCPFLARPDVFMFVKPTITKDAAAALGFDIHYQAQPSWRTYRAVLEMTEIYFELLGEFGPSDFIDVQSFFWVTGEAYGQR